MFRAILETRHFTFEVIASSAERCRDLLCEAWSKHQQQSGARASFSEVEGDIQISPMLLDVVYRDGQPL